MKTGLEKPLSVGYYSYMRTASISEAKNKLSALLDRVRAGDTILILDRGTPVAQLGPANEISDDAHLARLERSGIVRRGPGRPVPVDRLASPLAPGERPAGVLEALLEERREGR
jgi:prevent-host-death family protein